MANPERRPTVENRHHTPELEFNLASGSIITVTSDGLEKLVTVAEGAGFKKFTMMPFRGYNPQNRIQQNWPVVHIEEARSPTTGENIVLSMLSALAQQIKRLDGKEAQVPTLEDGLFPGREKCKEVLSQLLQTYPEAKLVSHTILPHRLIKTPSQRWLLKVNPAVEMDPQQLVDWSQETGVQLVFDPSQLMHLTREEVVSLPGQPTEVINSSLPLFHRLAEAGTVEVVDLGSNQQNIPDSIECLSKGELKELTVASREYDSIEFLRLELPIKTKDQIEALWYKNPFNLSVSLIKQARAIENNLQ